MIQTLFLFTAKVSGFVFAINAAAGALFFLRLRNGADRQRGKCPQSKKVSDIFKFLQSSAGYRRGE
jgi:hypothetical protein